MNLFNKDNITVNQSLRETANPVFNTAKMTLFHLASAGDEDAKKLVDKLGFTFEATQDAIISETSQNQLLWESIFYEIRFRTMNILIENSGFDIEVDLPCGYTPRAVQFSRKNKKFIGLDLPAAISEAEPAIMSLIDEEKRSLVKFYAVDATNYNSLEKVFDEINAPVCITTEGLLTYFTDSEAAVLCGNIRKILETHGGCWITLDPELPMQSVATAKVFCGDNFMRDINNILNRVTNKSDVPLIDKSMTINPFADIQAGTEKAMKFLQAHGLKVERMIVADYMPEIQSLSNVNKELVKELKAAMKNIGYWKITPDSAAENKKSIAESKKFNLDAKFNSGCLELNFTGRLDTLNSPEVLAFFEDFEKEHDIYKIVVNCEKLDYISSAGLRILLIMHKASKKGVTLEKTNKFIDDILKQTGFNSIFTLEK